MSVIDRTWIQKRSKEAVNWKRAVARYAATHLVNHGDVLYLASGTTLSALMWEIVSRQAEEGLLDLLVFTSNLQVIGMGRDDSAAAPGNNGGDEEACPGFLKAFQATQIVVTGGVLNPSLDSLIGDNAVRGITAPEVHPSTVFFGARGLSFKNGGLTITYQFIDELSAQVAYATRQTQRRVIVSDHTKVGSTLGLKAPICFGSLLEKANECIFLLTWPESEAEQRRVEEEIAAFESLCLGLARDPQFNEKGLAVWLITRDSERKKVVSLADLRRAGAWRDSSDNYKPLLETSAAARKAG